MHLLHFSVSFVFAVFVLLHCAMFFLGTIAIILYSTVLVAYLPSTIRTMGVALFEIK